MTETLSAKDYRDIQRFIKINKTYEGCRKYSKKP